MKINKKKIFIVKIGGSVIDNEKDLELFLKNFASIPEPKILVHGGGKIATKIGDQLKIEPRMVNGRRITDRQTLELVTMVYGGLINKNIVAGLQEQNCNAIGLTGADARVIPAHKRVVKDVDFGFVGDFDPRHINSDFILKLLAEGITPVFSPLTFSGSTLLNTNADTIASGLALALKDIFSVRLIFCFDRNGIYKDVDDEESLIHFLNFKKYNQLLSEGALNDGILPKLENAFNVLHNGVFEVVICHHSQILDNLEKQAIGTLIKIK